MEKKKSTQSNFSFARVWMFVSILTLGLVNLKAQSTSPVISCNTKLSWTITSNQINFTDSLLGPWGNANKRMISVKYSNSDSLKLTNIAYQSWPAQFIFAGNQYALVTISDSLGCSKTDSIHFVSSGVLCGNRMGAYASSYRSCDTIMFFMPEASGHYSFNLAIYDSMSIDFGDGSAKYVKSDLISPGYVIHKYNFPTNKKFIITRQYYYKDGCVKPIMDSFMYYGKEKPAFYAGKNLNVVYLGKVNGLGQTYIIDGVYRTAYNYDSFTFTQKGLHTICLRHSYPGVSCIVDSCITISIDSISCNSTPLFDIPISDSCGTNYLIFDFKNFNNLFDSVRINFGDASPTFTAKTTDTPLIKTHLFPITGFKYYFSYTYYLKAGCSRTAYAQHFVKTPIKYPYSISKKNDTIFLNSPDTIGFYVFSNGDWMNVKTSSLKVFAQAGSYSVCLKRFDSNDSICYLDSCISFTIDSIKTCAGYKAAFMRSLDSLVFSKDGNAINQTIAYVRIYRDNLFLQKAIGSKAKLIVTDTFVHAYRYEIVFDDSCQVIMVDTGSIKLNPINLDFTFTVSNNFVNFVNTTNNGNPYIIYYWEFGDTAMDYASNTSHVYKKAGLHNVCLNATYSQGGATSKICKSVNIANVIPIKDLSISLKTGSRIVGWDVYDTLRAKNKGITTESGNYYYKYNSKMTFVSSTPAPTSHNVAARLLTYTFNNWAPLSSQGHKLHFYVDSFATAGATICDSVWITPNTNDVNLANNLVSHCGILLGSYDPNEKKVDHEGDYDYKVAKTLTYEVGFQNTGTAPAKNIAIVDQLDQDLDWSTFKMIGSSHEYSARIDDGGALIVRYQNIYLADSFSNEPASHGHFTYSIDIASDKRVLGTEIENTANIFFDWNLPIQTNTVVTKLAVKKLSVSNVSTDPSVSIYPNPMTDLLHVHSLSEKIHSIAIHDVLGNVLNIPVQEQYNQSYQLNTSNLNKGLYFITIQTDKGNHIERVVKE